jgi:hypothetical protein
MTKQDNDQRRTDDIRARLLNDAFQGVKQVKAEYERRIEVIDRAQADTYAAWVRESALELMTSEAIPLADMGPIDWVKATVAIADAIWQETLAKAQERQGDQ